MRNMNQSKDESNKNLFKALCESNFEIATQGGPVLFLSLDDQGQITVQEKDKDVLISLDSTMVRPVTPTPKRLASESVCNASKFKGVSWVGDKKMWSANVMHRNKNVFIGDFNTQKEAAKAYDLKCYLYDGLKSNLNFGIPMQFRRARGNVIFIPGPNMWFVKVTMQDQTDVEIGYFKNADSAESAYKIIEQAFMSSGRVGLNYIRAFLFEKCFLATATSPMCVGSTNCGDVAIDGSNAKSTVAGTEGRCSLKKRKPLCMVCTSNYSEYVTISCFHVTLCTSCQKKCVNSYRNQDTSHKKHEIKNVSSYRYMCPICNVVCSLEKIDDLSPSINLSDYIPIRGTSHDLSNSTSTTTTNLLDQVHTTKRSPVFSFPRQVRESEDGFVIVPLDGFTYKLSVSMVVPQPTTSASSAAAKKMILNNDQQSNEKDASLKRSKSSGSGNELGSATKKKRKKTEETKTKEVDDDDEHKKEVDDDEPKKELDDAFKPRVFSKKSARVKSDFRGVCWDTRKQKWKSQIGHHGETLYLGHHEREQDAALAYDMAARKLHGNRSRCNFDSLGFRTNSSGNSSKGSGYKKPKAPVGHKPRSCRYKCNKSPKKGESSSSPNLVAQSPVVGTSTASNSLGTVVSMESSDSTQNKTENK